MLRLFKFDEEKLAWHCSRLREGEVRCRDLLARCRENYDRWEPTVHAWVAVDWESAAFRADELDRQFERGETLGPLHGVIVGVKDIIDVAGFPTLAGARFLDAAPKQHDATIVERLRAAGAIIVGKTISTQFAGFDPSPTCNPWDSDRTPGGSSSGSAAAVATGMCHVALGTQTGGSITRPASFCGIAGFKPTYAAVSLEGIYPLSPSLDHVGPIAGCVEDLIPTAAAMFDDEFQRQQLRRLAFEVQTNAPPAIRPRFGVCRFFDDRLDEEMAAAFRQTVARFGEQGAETVPIELPKEFVARVHDVHRTIMAAEAADSHRDAFDRFRDDYLPEIAALIERGRQIPDQQRQAALAAQQELRESATQAVLGANVHALLFPATTGAAPGRETTGDPWFNSPWSLTGMPTASLPIGLARGSLPLALQVVGLPGQDATVLRAALWCERSLPDGAQSQRA